MIDFPLPVGMTTRASPPSSRASIGAHCPRLTSEWPNRSVRIDLAASREIFFSIDKYIGRIYSRFYSGFDRQVYSFACCSITSVTPEVRIDHKSNVSHEIFAVAAPGLEKILAREIEDLGIIGAEVVEGGVSFRGNIAQLYEANLALRVASRVIVRVARFHADSFHEIE